MNKGVAFASNNNPLSNSSNTSSSNSNIKRNGESSTVHDDDHNNNNADLTFMGLVRDAAVNLEKSVHVTRANMMMTAGAGANSSSLLHSIDRLASVGSNSGLCHRQLTLETAKVLEQQHASCGAVTFDVANHYVAVLRRRRRGMPVDQLNPSNPTNLARVDHRDDCQIVVVESINFVAKTFSYFEPDDQQNQPQQTSTAHWSQLLSIPLLNVPGGAKIASREWAKHNNSSKFPPHVAACLGSDGARKSDAELSAIEDIIVLRLRDQTDRDQKLRDNKTVTGMGRFLLHVEYCQNRACMCKLTESKESFDAAVAALRRIIQLRFHVSRQLHLQHVVVPALFRNCNPEDVPEQNEISLDMLLNHLTTPLANGATDTTLLSTFDSSLKLKATRSSSKIPKVEIRNQPSNRAFQPSNRAFVTTPMNAPFAAGTATAPVARSKKQSGDQGKACFGSPPASRLGSWFEVATLHDREDLLDAYLMYDWYMPESNGAPSCVFLFWVPALQQFAAARATRAEIEEKPCRRSDILLDLHHQAIEMRAWFRLSMELRRAAADHPRPVAAAAVAVAADAGAAADANSHDEFKKAVQKVIVGFLRFYELHFPVGCPTSTVRWTDKLSAEEQAAAEVLSGRAPKKVQTLADGEPAHNNATEWKILNKNWFSALLPHEPIPALYRSDTRQNQLCWILRPPFTATSRGDFECLVYCHKQPRVLLEVPRSMLYLNVRGAGVDEAERELQGFYLAAAVQEKMKARLAAPVAPR